VSLDLRTEHTLSIFKNRMPRRIIGTQGLKKQRDGENYVMGTFTKYYGDIIQDD
jgi:hypothetical protein